MKRPGALSRKHGIDRTQFKRDPDAKQLARGSRIARESKKHKAESRRWSKGKQEDIAKNGDRCQFPGCTRRGCHAHHVKPRGRGGKSDSPRKLLCGLHHRRVHDHPKEAERLGLMVSGRQKVLPVSNRKLGKAA